MTEAEWNNCTDPIAMLQSMQSTLSDRKLRLFTCACLRRVWHLLPDESFREAVQETERTVETTKSMPEDAVSWWLRLDVDSAFAAVLGDRDVYNIVTSILVHAALTHAAGQVALWRAAHSDTDPVWRSHVAKLRLDTASEEEASVQSSLLRDVVSMPSRRICLEPMVLRWNDGIVQKLAQAAYEDRHLPSGTLDNGRLAVLADALEEAGCTDADILGHLRGTGPHVRGCWPVDLCLGKLLSATS